MRMAGDPTRVELEAGQIFRLGAFQPAGLLHCQEQRCERTGGQSPLLSLF